MPAPDYFIPDDAARPFYPLRDYLRAPSLHAAQQYIQTLTAPNALVVDPFGAMPTVAYAARNLGRRAIVVESNPLLVWLARAMATLPAETEINAALTKLGDAIKDDVPLRTHIAQLYATGCSNCGKLTPADYFTRTHEGGLVKRHYTCAQCGATRDDNATEDDLKRAQAFDPHGLHYHVAIDRVLPADGLHGERIHKMLDVYTPRNLYALVTLTQKIDSLFREPRERNILLLLLLHALDRGTAFYSEPDAPPQIKTHKQFVEFNLWREIEIAARALGESAPQLPLANSIGEVLTADTASVFIGRGNAQTVARELPAKSTALVLSAQPTRRWGILALTYFWGTWILGRPVTSSLIPFLESKNDFPAELRRYQDLLNDALKLAGDWLAEDGRAVFAFDETHQLAIEALLFAGANAGWSLESFLYQPRVGEASRTEFGDLRGSYRVALRARTAPLENGNRELPSEDARAAWQAKTSSLSAAQLDKAMQIAALEAGKAILTQRGEALAFSWLHHAAFARLMRDGLLAQASTAKLRVPAQRLAHDAVINGLRAGYADDFDHYQTPAQFLWVRRAPLEPPLIDRVEAAVREWLAKPERSRRPFGFDDLVDALYRQFPGDLTPEASLIELCVAAHQHLDADEKSNALTLLQELGARLEYQTVFDFRFAIFDAGNPRKPNIENFDVAWLEHGELAHGFIWRARAEFIDALQIHIAPACGYLVVPENIAPLMQEKARRLPHLVDAFHEASWNFVRVEVMRRLLASPKIERHDLPLLTGLVPPRLDEAMQLELL